MVWKPPANWRPPPVGSTPGNPFIKTAIKKKKGTPSLLDFVKGDPTYLQQLGAFSKSRGDFLADQRLNRNEYNNKYRQTRRDWALNRNEGFKNLKDDYAARGMIRSGLFNTAYGDFNRQGINQLTDLTTQKTGFDRSLAQELIKFTNELNIARQQALADAARRRAERYNL